MPLVTTIGIFYLWVVTPPPKHTHPCTHSNGKSIVRYDNIPYVLNTSLFVSTDIMRSILRSHTKVKEIAQKHNWWTFFDGHHIWISCTMHTHPVPLNSTHPAPCIMLTMHPHTHPVPLNSTHPAPCIMLTMHPHTLHSLYPTQPAHTAPSQQHPSCPAHLALIYILKVDWFLPLTPF